MGIALNQILWLLSGYLPMIYLISMDFAKRYSGYNERFGLKTRLLKEEFPKIDWFQNNSILLLQLNLLLIVFILLLLSSVIKEWKGISED